MSWDFELVAGPFSFTEGPAWDGEVVLFTDIPNSHIMRYDPGSGECTEFRTGTNEANGLMFDKEGQLYACEGGGRRMVRYNSDGTTTVLLDSFEGKRLNSPNDLAFDAEGSSGSQIRVTARNSMIWNLSTNPCFAWIRSPMALGKSTAPLMIQQSRMGS